MWKPPAAPGSAGDERIMEGDHRLSESHAGSEVTLGGEVDQIQTSLQKLWEKARRLSEFLLRLREENQSLRRRLEDLERRERELVTELKGREQEMQRLQSNGTGIFTHEEKEALAGRLRDLIAKLNARL